MAREWHGKMGACLSGRAREPERAGGGRSRVRWPQGVGGEQRTAPSGGPHALAGGGDYQDVFDYVVEQGGIALEQAYPYVSNNNFCS